MSNKIQLRPKMITDKLIVAFDDRIQRMQAANLLHNSQSISGQSLIKIVTRFDEILGNKNKVTTYGRVVKVDSFGKLIFAVLQDGKDRIELKLAKNVNPITFTYWCDLIRLGDIIVVHGLPKISKNGNPQIEVEEVSVLSVCALPAKHLGFNDENINKKRGRKRIHQQMMSNVDLLRNFNTHSLILQSIRQFLANNNFQEQLTPVLNKTFFGGRAYPFITHSRSEGSELYLRLTSEIALKMLITGGMSRIYEIGPSFRNETEDTSHLIGFNALEVYAPYTTFDEMLTLNEGLMKKIIGDIHEYGSKFPQSYQKLLDIGIETEFTKVSAKQAIFDQLGYDFSSTEGLEGVAQLCEREFPSTQADRAFLIYLVLKKFICPNLIKPTFITELPAGLSPFIENNDTDPSCLQRAFLVIKGIKLAEVFFSQRNPLLILAALERQAEEWQSTNIRRDYRDFVHALFSGIPPVSVMAMGTERLFMLFTGKDDVRRTKIQL